MTAFGAIISLELQGGADAAEAVADATRLWVHATSLGGVESTLERRRRWPEESPEVPDGLLRLSVGIEDVEDLWADLVRCPRLGGRAPRLTRISRPRRTRGPRRPPAAPRWPPGAARRSG